MNESKPNLFIVGAMKSGTSTLCDVLDEHPSIFMCPKKEPMYFARMIEPGGPNESDYLRLFGGAGEERYLAEGSTEYTKRPFHEGVAERIAAMQPDARIVYMMRQPFDRIVSQYRHQVRAEVETRSLSEALKYKSDYLTNSHYAHQIAPYIEQFGRERVYLCTFEDFVERHEQMLAELFDWLGIDPSPARQIELSHRNASEQVLALPDRQHWLRRLRTRLRQYRRLHQWIPVHWKKRLADALPGPRGQAVDSKAVADELEQARRLVAPILAAWQLELEALTGRPFEAWPAAQSPEPDALRQAVRSVWLPDAWRDRLIESP